MKTSSKIILGIVGIAIIVLIVVSVTQKPKVVGTEGVVKVGASLALTGDAVVWGEAEKNSIEMAVDEINQKGGVKGKKLN